MSWPTTSDRLQKEPMGPALGCAGWFESDRREFDPPRLHQGSAYFCTKNDSMLDCLKRFKYNGLNEQARQRKTGTNCRRSG